MGAAQREPVDEKLGELLLLVAQQLADEPAAGSMKVNKILFFAEFTHVRKTGRPITGVEYQRLPNGPAPRPLRRVRRALIERGDATLREESYFGYTQHRIVALRPVRRELFASDEIESIEEVLAAYKSWDGASLSAISHQEPAWDRFEDGETIPYQAAFLSSDPPGPGALDHARKLSEQSQGR